MELACYHALGAPALPMEVRVHRTELQRRLRAARSDRLLPDRLVLAEVAE